MDEETRADDDQSWEAVVDWRLPIRVGGFVQRSAVAAQQTEVPGPAVTIVFVLAGEMRLGEEDRLVQAAVVGLRSVPLTSSWSGPVECLEMRLSPLQMFALSGGRPMSDISDGIIDLDDLLALPDGGLDARVRSARGWDARFDVVQHYLGTASAGSVGSSEVREAWSMLTSTGGRVGVAELCSATGWSAKRLRIRFRREIGVTPKHAARLIRFGVAHERLSSGVAPAVVAAESGFADQSHLHRDVVGFSGMTPATLARRPHGF